MNSNPKAKVFLSTPMDVSTSTEYAVVLSSVRREFPRFHVWEGSKLFSSVAEWESDWPVVAREVTALIVYPRPDLSIGAGVYRELATVFSLGRPIVVVDGKCRYFHLRAVRRWDNIICPRGAYRPVLPGEHRHFKRFATVIHGKPIKAGSV